jgi:hypothetical protein
MKEMTPADRLFIEIFIVTPQSEKLWQKVAEYFTRLVQAADDSMFIGWPNPQVAKPHPYVQMRKDCSVIHLEALSSFLVVKGDSHTLTTATSRSFNHYGIANLSRNLNDIRNSVNFT